MNSDHWDTPIQRRRHDLRRDTEPYPRLLTPLPSTKDWATPISLKVKSRCPVCDWPETCAKDGTCWIGESAVRHVQRAGGKG